ncbi:7-carboxy-7-deazaguanine synthase QueE [Campylobacter insulaenigrae]|uniref:7-carboxy-7-deazaguanine synthase n=1 Tax=Campylobacter insulaenigrae NCTC 12927 TaxID=1031564 RepID=A0A0A8H3S7_9BACT|nr:7-carboxy-7-deazaguanine synthase QueE [Campylobacter insulaenigrae]AJC88325.1 7-carboxy-7-deazaguanine synthase [Campylobacter insulaenigrae NCTC 12927]VEH95753.1 radical SAM domain protein [Campylobacter insulaenigrae]
MEIVETFLSIQGEGAYSGKLAIFVRFAGCNFNCIGFGVSKKKDDNILIGCDTIRAVFTKNFASTYKKYTAQELFNEVIFLKKDFNPIIVITGGEPLLYYKNEEFLKWIKLLLEQNFLLHFETNASIEIDFKKYPVYEKCYFSLGVKLSNSGVSKEKRINKKALQAFKKNAKGSFYKFVLDEDFIFNHQAQEEIREILTICENEVYCMPMGSNREEISKNALSVAEFCIKNGYNYSDRLHIRVWGDKEGV